MLFLVAGHAAHFAWPSLTVFDGIGCCGSHHNNLATVKQYFAKPFDVSSTSGVGCAIFLLISVPTGRLAD